MYKQTYPKQTYVTIVFTAINYVINTDTSIQQKLQTAIWSIQIVDLRK